MTNKFEYLNIFDPNIYSDIHSHQNLNTNIFGYSFVSKNFIRIYSDIRSYHFLNTNIFGYSFVSKSIRMLLSETNKQTNFWMIALSNEAEGNNSNNVEVLPVISFGRHCGHKYTI